MVGLTCGIGERRRDIVIFEKWIIFENFGAGSPRSNQIEDITHSQPLPTDARAASAFPLINSDSFEKIH